METKIYTNVVDKSEWERGPWDNEPDKMQWLDETTKLPCLIVRGPLGALCGYVGVSEAHPLYGKDYSDTDIEGVVHGGLTYSDKCSPDGDEQTGICHIPAPGEPDHVWWFGFDCAHYNDYMPAGTYKVFRGENSVYRTIEYVQNECRDLARALRHCEEAAKAGRKI